MSLDTGGTAEDNPKSSRPVRPCPLDIDAEGTVSQNTVRGAWLQRQLLGSTGIVTVRAPEGTRFVIERKAQARIEGVCLRFRSEAGRIFLVEGQEASAPGPVLQTLSEEEIRTQEKNRQRLEVALRAGLVRHIHQGSEWAEKVVRAVLRQLHALDETRPLTEQLTPLNTLTIPIRNMMHAVLAAAPQHDGQRAFQDAVRAFCTQLASGNTIVGSWVKSLPAAPAKPSPSPSLEKHMPLAAGKLPSATRALQLLSSDKTRQVEDGLSMLGILMGSARYAEKAAANPAEVQDLAAAAEKLRLALDQGDKKTGGALRVAMGNAGFRKVQELAVLAQKTATKAAEIADKGAS